MAVLLTLQGGKNTAFVTYVALPSQANAKIMQVNPTLAAGDAKVSIDGAALGNLATLPAVTPAGSSMVKVSLSAAEMNGADITVVLSDAAGAEWEDVVLSIRCNATLTLKQLAITNPAGSALLLASTGSNGSGIHATGHGSGHGIYGSGALDGAGSGIHGRGGTDGISAQGYGVGAGLALHGGLANGSAFAAGAGSGLLAQGDGTGAGLQLVGGPGVGATYGLLVDGGTKGGVLIRAGSGSNQAGLWVQGDGTGGATWFEGKGTGPGLRLTGGSTSGDGIFIDTTSGHGVNIVPVGTAKHGLRIKGGTTGDGINVTSVDGHGINLAPSGTSRHGLFMTGASLGTSDGFKAVAGAAGGVDIRGNITGNLSGSIGSVGADGIAAAALAADAGAEIAAAVFATAMTEAYSTKNGTVTLAQALYELLSYNQERAIAGPVMTAFKRDGATPAMTMTLDSATAPRTVTRAT